MTPCPDCGVDLDRELGPFEELHRRRSDATDPLHFRPGAENISVDVGRARRLEMNRIRQETALTLGEQVRRALDLWFLTRRVRAAEREQGRG
jgi:hypothetical protein